MSVPDTGTAVSTRQYTVPLVRPAVPADYPAIRNVVMAAYRQYADLIALDVFSPYLADVLDLDTHARHGRLLVVEVDEQVCASAAFYPDASVQGFGWPSRWASGRALAVHPDARGHGVARALLATCERLAREAGAPVFAFHTASFMTSAIALYERLGYRRASEFDFDMAARFSPFGAAPIMSIAYFRQLTWAHPHADGMRRVRCAVNPAYRTDELAYVVRQAGIRLLVAAPSFRTSDYAAMIEDARPGCPDLRWVVLLGSADWDALPDRAGDPHALAARQALLSPDDPINIQYTSGTTGHPKGATLSHHNILNNAHLIGEILGYTELDRICVPVPLYHTFGMVIGNLGATTHGACLVYPAPAFDPAATLAAVAEERCTSLYGVPAMFIAELAQPGFDAYDLSSLRTGVMAGAPCPVEVMKQVVDRMGMTDVTIAYGMTETSPVSAQTRAGDTLDRRVYTVGRVHPHVEIKIVDAETGVTVPRGVPGELCTRGYSVMLGYWQEPGKTAEAIDAARWMHTGDLAVMDADGYVNITGQLKDMVIRGGEKVSPREIEEYLHTHPDVQDVHVIGVPDDQLGEEIMAWIRLRPGARPMTAADVRAYADGKLARYKIPRYVRIVEDFPMTASGKVRKVDMRKAAIDMLGLTDIAASQYA